MSETIAVTCPGCSAKLKAPAAQAGRSLACPKCRLPITVPGAGAVASPVMTGATPATAAVGTAGGLKKLWRPPSVWTKWDHFWVKLAVPCLIMGVLAHVLPHFGLQFRKLAQLGNAAPTAGTGLAVFGGFLLLYVFVLRGHMLRILLGGAALVIIGVGVVLTIGYCSSRRSHTYTPPPPPQIQGGPSAPLGPRPGAPSGPQGMNGPPSGYTPPSPPARPRVDYASVVERYGAGRVARISFHGGEGVDLSATIRARLAAMDAASKPQTWSLSTSGGVAELTVAPVTDFEVFASTLDMGAVSGIDAAERRAVVTVDAAKCVPKKK